MKDFKNSLPISRRNLLKAGATVGAVALMGDLVPMAYGAGEQITIFTWETYHDDDWIAQWTARTGVKVNVIRTGSVDEMYAKLRSGAVEADLIYLDVGSMPRLIAGNVIAPIDPSKVSGASNIASGLKWQERCTIQGKVWGVPYNWGTQPLMYNADVVKPKPASWKVLWDKQYEGRVNLPDDAYITFQMIALSIKPKDPFNLTDAEFEQCAQALRDLRPQLRTIARGIDDATTIYASGDADLGYCQNISSVFQLQGQGKKFDFSFPDEGTPAWIDCAILTPRGTGRKVVYDFINDNLTPQWQSRFIGRSLNNGVIDSSLALKAGMTKEVLAKTNILSEEEPGFWNKMSFSQNPENIDRRLEIWNAFKAGTL
ncbi:substrate-binding domain-containing protein [Pseudomonas sp. GB2N2]